jgi:hypothetical protein
MKSSTILICAYLLNFTLFGQVTPNVASTQHTFNDNHSESAYMWSNEPFGQYSQNSEIKEKRDENSKHFKNADGSVTAHLAAGKINYFEDGKWKTVFHTIESTPSGFRNITNSHKTYYPATSTGAISTILEGGATFKDMMGMRMYYEVNGNAVQSQNISSKQGMVNFNKLTYSGVYGNGIDLHLTQQTTKRKMDYIIQNINSLTNIPSGAQFLVFEEKVQLPNGWTAQLSDNEILLKDLSGNVIAKYEKPVFHDTHVHHHEGGTHNEEYNEINGTYQISQSGNNLTIKTKVPLTWLMSGNLNFPVTIDPTVNCYADNNAAWTGYLRVNNDYGIGTVSNQATGVIVIGKQANSGNKIFNGWAKFNITNVPDNGCIQSLSLTYRIHTNYTGDSDCRVHTHMRHMNGDPSAQYSAANYTTLLTDIKDGDIYETRNLAVNGSASNPTYTVPLNNNIHHLSTQLAANWFAVGFDNYASPGNGHDDCYVRIYGMDAGDRPYLSVTYNIPSTFPPFTVSTPVSSLCVGGTTTLTANLPASYSSCNYTTTYTGTTAQTVFTGSDVFQNLSGSAFTAQVLVVGGGGGGGRRHAGGGGAGGVLYNASYNIPTGNHNVTVGSGGNGGISGDNAQGSKGGNGGNSVFGTMTAIGGGGGAGNENGPGNSGGSGGGGCNRASTAACCNGDGGAGTAGQGNNGGSHSANAGSGCGGGGAGAAGANSATGSAGGVGANYSATFGTAVGQAGWFGGGGGGGTNGTTAFAGGNGGGGAGGISTAANRNGINGQAYTGGGGGGGGANSSGSGSTTNNGSGGFGGSGVVIIKHPAGAWSSSNPTVATVNATTGAVTAQAAGYATITYTTTYGTTASTTIIVSNNSVAGILVKRDPTTCSPANGTVTAYIQEDNFKGASTWYRDDFNGASAQVGTRAISGNAALNNNNLRLTEAANSVNGTLSIANPAGFNTSSVAASFDLFIGAGTGADGFEFRYGMMKVRFDTYNNADANVCEGENTSSGRIGVGVYYNDVLLTSGCHQYLNIRNMWQNVFFFVDVSGRVTLKVGNTTLFTDLPIINAGINQENYLAADKSGWTWTFFGHTGGANDEHRIDNLDIRAFNNYQFRLNGGAWQTGTGAVQSYAFTGLGAGTHTVEAQPRSNGVCSLGTVGTVTTIQPTVSVTPTATTVCPGANASFTATVTPPNIGTRYRLILTSAYGTGWHGIQEVRGRNQAGVFQTLSCEGASSATYTDDRCNSAEYGAANAFDGDFGTTANNVQWLTPEQEVITATWPVHPHTNWRNVYNTTFPSPEWVEFSSTGALAELLIRNGRYDSGASTTCFRDYHVMSSTDGGITWIKIKEGVLINDQTNDQVISLIPSGNNIVWKRSGTPIATGATLNLTNVTASDAGTYTVEVGYDACNIVSQNVTLNVATPSTSATATTGGGTYCHGNTITLNASGGTNGANAVHVWYKGGCNNAFTETWNTQPYPAANMTVNSINNGILNVTSTNGDPVIDMSGLGSFNPNVYKYINIRYRVTAGAASNMQLFYYNGLYGSANALQRKDVAVSSPLNTWQVVSVDMSTPTTGNWFHSNITGWRFDWAITAGCTMEIDFIQLSEFPMINEDNTTTQLEWTSVHPDYPQAGTTTYATGKIDNCGATGCISTTVTLPTKGTVLAQNGESATCTINANETVHFYHSSGRYIASVSANATALGSTVATTYTPNDPYANPIMTSACNDAGFQTATLGRHWVINPTVNASGTVRLPYYDEELNLLMPATTTSTNPYDAVSGQANLGLSKYSGPNNVNSSWNDNCTPLGGNGGTTWQGPNSYGNISAYVTGWPANTNRYSLFNISGFSEFWLHASDPHVTPLSVTLSNFSAECLENKTQIRWTTANEQNSDFFQLERSRDGLNWEVVTTVDGAGTVATPTNYLVSDNAFNEVYYRLKQTDFDGKSEYFGPIAINCAASNELIVYPNPNTGKFTVAINASEAMGAATVLVHDVSGKLVASGNVNVLSGTNTVHFQDNNLVRGTYIVSVKNEKQELFTPVKLIVQ